MSGEIIRKNTGFLSILRILSAFAVVAIHVAASSVANYLGDISQIVVYVLDTVHVYLNWSVPVFFMITGYIFIGKKSDCEFYKMKKYIIRFLVALFLFGFCYAMLERVYSVNTININVLISSIGDVFTGNLWNHMWYVYEIIGIYLVLPIVKPFTEKNNKNLIYAVILTFIFNILLPSISDILCTQFAFSIPIVRYMFYIFAGGLIAKKRLIGSRKNIVCVVCGVIISVWMVGLFYRNGVSCAYNSLAICMLAIMIFLLFSLIFEEYIEGRFIKEISSLTWGVYLVHPLVINILIKVVKVNPLEYPPYLSIPVFCISIFTVSLLLTLILRRIPFVKKIL